MPRMAKTPLLAIGLLPTLAVLATSASACHPAPQGSFAECAWADPPFGAVPWATNCATYLAGFAIDNAVWTVETAEEALFGC